MQHAILINESTLERVCLLEETINLWCWAVKCSPPHPLAPLFCCFQHSLSLVASSKLAKPSAGARFYRGVNPEPLGPLATSSR